LLQLASCRVAELCARPPQIVRGKIGEATFGGIQLDHVPNDAFRDTIAPPFTSSADTTEYLARMQVSGSDPRIQGCLNPFGDGNRSNVPALANEIEDGPVLFRCCRCVNSRWASSRRRRPQPSKTARMARSRLPFKVSGSGLCQKRRASSAVSQLPTLTPSFLGPLTRRMLAANSGLSKPAIDCGRRQATVLQENAKARDHHFVKGKPWLRRIPLNELIDGMSICSFGLWRTQAVEDGRLAVVQIRKAEFRFRLLGPVGFPVDTLAHSSRLPCGWSEAYAI
jgi:hypothetical protein